jgi:cell division protein FtsW
MKRRGRLLDRAWEVLGELPEWIRDRGSALVEPLRDRLSAWSARRAAARDAAPASTEPRGLDVLLLFVVLSLVALGMVLVYTSSAVYAQASTGSGSHFLRRHLIFVAVGMGALYVGWRLDYSIYRRFAYPMLGACALLLVALVVGLGTRVEGATRWFHIGGISVQPSEAVKFALVVYLASSLARKQDTVKTFSVGFLPHLCVAGLVCLLILRQPDLGTAAVIGSVTLLMLFVAGTKLSYIVISLLAVAPIVYQLIVGTPWRMRRLLAFLDPWAHRQDAGYQISESLISIGSGGLYGLGLGDGKQKLFFLPAAHTDFIFAIAGEELGLVGLVGIVVLFLILIVRGMRASLGARDLFGTYLAFGLTSIYGLQALLHIAVVLGLVPTKGITLPLVSYGGSAMASTLFCVGVLLNIAARRPEPVATMVTERRALPTNRKRPARVVVSEGASET